MFMGGYGARVFLKLKELDVLRWIFPANDSSSKAYNLELLITKALESTDERAENMPITPRFYICFNIVVPVLKRAEQNFKRAGFH